MSRFGLRFSLKAMLIVVTLASVWFALAASGAREEKQAAKAIEAVRGKIVYDRQIRPPGSARDFNPVPPGPGWLREWVGNHWFDRIVEVRLIGWTSPRERNRFSVVAPHLAKLTGLRELAISNRGLGPADYSLLGQLSTLEVLRLWQKEEISAENMAALAGSTSLRELHFDNAMLSPQAIERLSQLPILEVLDIDCKTYDRSTGKLLQEYQLDDDAAAAISSFPKLRKLMLFATQITDEGLASICRLSDLKTLVVSSPNITSASFDSVTKLQSLEHLGTWQWKIEGSHFEKLSQMPNLRSLGLVTHLTDESMPFLVKLDRLERLTVRGEAITDASIVHLVNLNNLEWLNLSDTSIDKLGLQAQVLKQALPTCKIALPMTEKQKEMERHFHLSKWRMMQSR